MNVRSPVLAIILMLAFHLGVAAAQETPSEPHLMVFRNGDHLAGTLETLNTEGNELRWYYPEVAPSISFPLNDLSYLDFGVGSIREESNFLLGLVTGEQIPVQLRSISRDSAEITLPWGERKSIARKAIQYGQRLPGLSEPIYEGIIADDWSAANRGQNWTERSGELVSSGYSSTQADLKIPEKACLNFDLSLTEEPSLNLFLCGDGSRDGGAHAYYFQITARGITAQRQHGASPRKYTTLDKDRELSPSILAALQQRDVLLTLYLDRPNGSLHLFINGEKAMRFSDRVSPAPDGTSVLLANLGKGDIRLRNLSVHQWDGAGVDDVPSVQGNQARVAFSHGIRSTSLEQLSDGQFRVSGSQETFPLTDLRSFQWPHAGRNSPTFLRTHFGPTGFIDFAQGSVDQGVLVANHSFLGNCRVPLTAVDALVINPNQNPLKENADSAHDCLDLRNGDQLHGRLIAWSPEEGLRWEIQHGGEFIDFPDHQITKVRLGGETEPSPIPQATVTLFSGIEIPGTLVELDETQLSFETHFSEPMQIDRSAVRRLDLRNPDGVRYTGPREGETWITSSADQETWRIQDGALQTSISGHVGREIDWPDRVRLDVSIEWESFLAFSISWFTQRPNEPLSPYGYTLQCDHASFTLLRGDRTTEEIDADNGLRNARLDEQLEKFHARYSGVRLKRLGSPVPIKDLELNGRAHFTLCLDRISGEIDLFVNGKWIRQWQDPEGISPEAGKGLVFSHQRTSSTLRVTEVRISEWNGAMPRSVEPPEDPTLAKLVLENEDEMLGTVSSIRDRQVHVASDLGEIHLSQDRVRSVFLETSKRQTTEIRKGMVVEGLFQRSGSALFFLNGLANGVLNVSSPYHADNKFNLKAFRELRFDMQDRKFWTAPEPPQPRPVPHSIRSWLLGATR